MFRALARRERRPLWVAFSLIFAAGIGVSLWAGVQARGEAVRRAGIDAEIAAQAALAPLLQPRDLMAPIVGERARSLETDIVRAFGSAGPIEDVRIYSSLGRILYASDPDVVGARPSYLRNVTFQVANGKTQSLVRDGLLQTYVPIWLNPGGTVAVAELTQPFGPIDAEATGPWFVFALIAGGLLLGCVGMVTVTTRTGAASPASRSLYQPAVPRRTSRRGLEEAPAYQHPGFRAIEQQRHEAERRAEAAEQNFRSVQGQLKETLAQVKDLEGRLAMNETQNTTNDGELRALRDQLRESSERLHKAELDNNALRERMALRRHELDEARQQATLGGTNGDVSGPGGDVAELWDRLDAAEARTAEMAHEIERLESELDYTKSKFHMTKLSEALREFDNDDIEIQEGDDLYEHPVVIRNRPGRSKSQTVR